jgi:hypothetical protein
MSIKAGDIINLDEKHHETLDKLFDQSKNAKVAFKCASEFVRESHEKLFEYIREARPDLGAVEFRYDHEKKQLVAMTNFDARRMKIKEELDLSKG